MKTLSYLKKFTLVSLFAFVLIQFSCKAQGGGKDVLFDLSDMQFDFSNLRLADELVVFEYESVDQIPSDLERSINELIRDALEIIDNNEGTSNIAIGIDIGEGKAVINSVHYYKFQKVTEEYTRAETNGRSAFPIGTMINLFEEKRCLGEWSEVASCKNNREQIAGCLGENLHNFISENVTGLWDCAQVMIKVGLSNTVICGGGC